MGRHGGKTENDTLLRSHITLAYFYVETRIKRQTADEAIDFVSIRTEFEYVERFVRYRSSKFMWSKQKSWIRVSHAQNEGKLECRPVLRNTIISTKQIVATAKIFTLNARFLVIL